MGSAAEGLHNNLRACQVHLLAFQEVVDHVVADAEGFLVGAQGAHGFQIGGRDLLGQTLISSKGHGQVANAPLGEAAQRTQIKTPVAEFGENAHDRFGSVVRSDHQSDRRARNCVLGDHAFGFKFSGNHGLLARAHARAEVDSATISRTNRLVRA